MKPEMCNYCHRHCHNENDCSIKQEDQGESPASPGNENILKNTDIDGEAKHSAEVVAAVR